MTTKKDTCFTCEIVSEYTGLANRFTTDLSEALLFPMWTLYLSFVGLWIVIQGLRLVMVHVGPAEVLKEFAFVMIAGFLLSGQGPELVNNIYRVSLASMSGAASVALQVGDESPTVTANAAGAIPLDQGMTALVRSAENGIKEVFVMAGYIAGEATLTNPLPILYALVLVVPFFLVLIVYFTQVVIAIFRIMVLATFSPFLMLGFAFGWGRDMMKSGIRTLISAFMVLFGATAALAVMLYGVKGLEIGAMPPGKVSDLVSLQNATFLIAITMGWLGTAFMTEATGMANSIVGSALTNSAAAVVTGGATATALALKSNPVSKYLGGQALGATGTVASKIGWGAAGIVTNPAGATAATAHTYGKASQVVKDLVARARDYGQDKASS